MSVEARSWIFSQLKSIYYLLKSQLEFLYCWLISSHEVFGWVVAIAFALSVFALYQAWNQYQRWRAINVKRQPLDYLKYTTDEFYNFKWVWTWKKYQGKYIPTINVPQICPQCMGDLRRITHDRILLNCINLDCNYSLPTNSAYYKTFNLDEQLVNKIMIKVRSQQYKKIIE